MILDTSAIVAVLLREPGWEGILRRIDEAPYCAVGAPTLAEAGVVLSARLAVDARGHLARFLQESGVDVLAFGEEHYVVAVEAWRRFGKTRHPARLNFGDCLSYAMARLAGQPLLFVGDDFAQTDVERA